MRFAKNAQHDTSKVLRLPRKITMDTSKVLRLLPKLQRIVWKRHKSIAPATQNDFQHVAKHVWMSRSATPATRNEATTRLKPPKMTTSAELPIGTAIWSSRGRLRTVANGCERLLSWTQRRANTPSTPRPPEWNGNPCYAFGKNGRMGILQGIAHGSNRMLWLKMAQGSEHLVKSRWQAWHLCDRFISLTLGFWHLVGFWMGQNGWLGWNGWKGWAGACLSKIINWFLVVKLFNKEVF